MGLTVTIFFVVVCVGMGLLMIIGRERMSKNMHAALGGRLYSTPGRVAAQGVVLLVSGVGILAYLLIAPGVLDRLLH